MKHNDSYKSPAKASHDASAGDFSARSLLESGLDLMRASLFGEAVNMLREAASAEDADSYVRNKALAAIDVINEINGFVNKDLMNP